MKKKTYISHMKKRFESIDKQYKKMVELTNEYLKKGKVEKGNFYYDFREINKICDKLIQAGEWIYSRLTKEIK